MPLPIPDKPGQLFDNPDSYAMVFDDAWRRLAPSAAGNTTGGATDDARKQIGRAHV